MIKIQTLIDLHLEGAAALVLRWYGVPFEVAYEIIFKKPISPPKTAKETL